MLQDISSEFHGDFSSLYPEFDPKTVELGTVLINVVDRDTDESRLSGLHPAFPPIVRQFKKTPLCCDSSQDLFLRKGALCASCWKPHCYFSVFSSLSVLTVALLA